MARPICSFAFMYLSLTSCTFSYCLLMLWGARTFGNQTVSRDKQSSYYKSMTRIIITNLLISLLVTGLVGCGSGSDEHVKSTDVITQLDSANFKQAALQFSQGKQLFRRYCNTCHYAPERMYLTSIFLMIFFKDYQHQQKIILYSTFQTVRR